MKAKEITKQHSGIINHDFLCSNPIARSKEINKQPSGILPTDLFFTDPNGFFFFFNFLPKMIFFDRE